MQCNPFSLLSMALHHNSNVGNLLDTSSATFDALANLTDTYLLTKDQRISGNFL